MKRLYKITAKPNYYYLVSANDFWEAGRLANKATKEIVSITEFEQYGLLSPWVPLETLERRMPIDVVAELTEVSPQTRPKLAPKLAPKEVKPKEAMQLYIWTLPGGQFGLLNEDGYMLSITKKHDYILARSEFASQIDKWSTYLEGWYSFVEASGQDMVRLKGLHDSNFKAKRQLKAYEKNVLKITK